MLARVDTEVPLISERRRGESINYDPTTAVRTKFRGGWKMTNLDRQGNQGKAS